MREHSDSHNVVVEQLVVEPQEKICDEMRVSSEDELTDLRVFAERSKRPHTTNQVAGTMFLHMFLKIRIVKSASSQRLLELRGIAGQHEETVFIYRKFWVLKTADHTVLSEENDSRLQHRYAVVVQDLSFYWIYTTPPNSNCARNDEKCAKVLAARSKTRHCSYFSMFVKTYVGTTTNQLNTAQ